jgi:hypothetical protein
MARFTDPFWMRSICRSDFSAFPTRAITGLLFSVGSGRYFDLNDESGSCCSKINLDKGRARIRGSGSREPRRKSVAAIRHRSFAQEQIMPLAGAETKNRTFMHSQLRKGPALYCLAAIPNGCKGHFQIPWRGFALRPGCDPEAAISQSPIRLLLFL